MSLINPGDQSTYKGNYNSAEKISGFYQQLFAQACSQPGVKAAGFISFLPSEGRAQDDIFRIAEHGSIQFLLRLRY